MTWLMIYWLLANPSGYAPTGTAEFADQAACVGALRAIAAAGPWTEPPGVCVPKATATGAAATPSIDPGFQVPVPPPATPAPAVQPTTPGTHTCPPGSPRATC